MRILVFLFLLPSLLVAKNITEVIFVPISSSVAKTPEGPIYLSSHVYKVASIVQEPYLMVKERDVKSQNDKYFGFMKDLLDQATFSSNLHIIDDKLYHHLGNETAVWSGITTELQSKNTDFVAADITITTDRMRDADFTIPFMSAGITAVFTKIDPRYGAFKGEPMLLFHPFTIGVWSMMLLSLAATIVCLYIISRVNPNEWKKAAERRLVPECEGQNFTRSKTVMFCVSTMLFQGYRKLPRSAAGQFLTAIWWVFTLFILLSYVASLMVQFLERSKEIYEPRVIHDFQDLNKQENMKFCIIGNSPTAMFFKNSQIPPYTDLWSKITNNNCFVNSTSEGLKRVRNGKGGVTFLMETDLADYYVNKKPCDLATLTKPLLNRFHGFATKKNSSLVPMLNSALLKILESGKLESVYKKWFIQQCQDSSYSSGDTFLENVIEFAIVPYSKQPIGLLDVEIAFIMIFVGLFLATCISAIEMLIHRNRKHEAQRVEREEEWEAGGDSEMITRGNSVSGEIH